MFNWFWDDSDFWNICDEKSSYSRYSKLRIESQLFRNHFLISLKSLADNCRPWMWSKYWLSFETLLWTSVSRWDIEKFFVNFLWQQTYFTGILKTQFFSQNICHWRATSEWVRPGQAGEARPALSWLLFQADCLLSVNCQNVTGCHHIFHQVSAVTLTGFVTVTLHDKQILNLTDCSD